MPDANGYAALWDVDGTLVDTAEMHFAAWAATAQERDWPFDRDDFARTFGRRNPEIIHTLFGDALTDRERSTWRIARNCCIGRRPARASNCCRACGSCSKTWTRRAFARPSAPAHRGPTSNSSCG